MTSASKNVYIHKVDDIFNKYTDLNTDFTLGYPIDFTRAGKRFALSLHYNRGNSFFFVNVTNIYQSEKKTLK